MGFLRRQGAYREVPRPDLILLDLNLPRMGGIEILQQMQHDDSLRRIPVIVLTTSASEQDVLASYDLNAKAYIRKPIQFDDFMAAMKSFDGFWLTFVTFPPS